MLILKTFSELSQTCKNIETDLFLTVYTIHFKWNVTQMQKFKLNLIVKIFDYITTDKIQSRIFLYVISDEYK